MGIMRYEHPREDALFDLLEAMPIKNERFEALEDRTFDLLDVYSQYGRLEVELLPRPLADWAITSQKSVREATAKGDMHRYWEMMGLVIDRSLEVTEMTPAAYIMAKIASNHRKEALQLEEQARNQRRLRDLYVAKRHIPMGKLRPDSPYGKALNGLYPVGMVYVNGEERCETIWWHYLWLWRDYLADWQWPRAKMDLRLNAFVKLQEALLNEGVLTEVQVSLVALARQLGNQPAVALRRRAPVL